MPILLSWHAHTHTHMHKIIQTSKRIIVYGSKILTQCGVAGLWHHLPVREPRELNRRTATSRSGNSIQYCLLYTLPERDVAVRLFSSLGSRPGSRRQRSNSVPSIKLRPSSRQPVPPPLEGLKHSAYDRCNSTCVL